MAVMSDSSQSDSRQSVIDHLCSVHCCAVMMSDSVILGHLRWRRMCYFSQRGSM